MVALEPIQSFRDLLLRHRARSGLTQRALAARLGVNRRSLQEWEVGLAYPTAERLEALVHLLLEEHGLTPGQEAAEAQMLWEAVQRESPRTRAPFDRAWFARLQAEPTASAPLAAPTSHAQPTSAQAKEAAEPERRQDWGESPDIAALFGRAEELALLRRCVLDERCRLVAVLGMGGIGKTSLVSKLAHDLASDFERVYWRSLRDAPPPSDWLAGSISFLSDHRVVPPAGDSKGIAMLLQLLRDRPCLLVLDNAETLLEPGEHEGRYRAGLDGYGRLFQSIGEAPHQSCLVLTSREAPPELSMLADGAARTLSLGGLADEHARALLSDKQLTGTPEQWAALTGRFGGNGLALKIIGESIRELFDGDIGQFLQDSADGAVFGGVRGLLAEQVKRSSPTEQRVLRALAVEREPTPLRGLLADFGPPVGRAAALEAVEALRRRSLIERAELPHAVAFTLQSVVLEYVTDRLVEDVTDEIHRAQPMLLVEQPLLKAQAKDYVRQSQERVIVGSILRRLEAMGGTTGTESGLLALLELWRRKPGGSQGYGPGNVLNLLRVLRGHLRGLDLSRLAIRQAYLAEVEAQDASMAGSQLVDSVLPDAFDFPGSIAISADGACLAAGTQTGQVWLWRLADRTPLMAVQAHTAAVWGVALSADGHLLASGGADARVRLWDTTTASAVATLEGHAGVVRSVALSADGRLLASGGTDGTVRLWDTRMARPLATLQGHAGGLYRLALSADGRLLASVGTDGVVRLWDTGTAAAATLQGHPGSLRCVALSADGHLLATGATDGLVQLWETSTGRLTATLTGHVAEVHGVALSAQGKLLASGGADGVARVWDTSTGQAVATCRGGVVWGVAMPADGQLLVSGGTDGAVRLWDTGTGQPLATMQGHTGTIRSVALSADGGLAASGGEDAMVRVWDVESGRLVVTLQGHTSGVLAVSLSADGHLVASSSGDASVRLWDISTRRQIATLLGHAGGIRSVALCSDGHLVASGGTDGTVRVWDAGSRQLLATLLGHAGEVRGVALSAAGDLLASGGADGTLRVWNTGSGQPVATLPGHAGEVWGLALSADGELLASGGADGSVSVWETATGRAVATLKNPPGGVLSVALAAGRQILLATGGADGTVLLWEVNSGRQVVTLRSHTAGVPGLALSADGQRLATGSYDGTARVWDTSSGVCLHTLRAERRYERLDITGLEGISAVQHERLLALGAFERNVTPVFPSGWRSGEG